MDLNKRIKELQEELDEIKAIQHNTGMNGAANSIGKKLVDRATYAELKFKQIAELKKLHLKFQHRIDIMKGLRIERFYFADFCDIKNKLIFEIDGEYHYTPEQKKKDWLRTRDLARAGYKVFRISNEDVVNGKTTSFLVNAYKKVGITLK